MSRPSLELTPGQFDELRLFADGEPVHLGVRPNTNLIRRNMLALAPLSGVGYYRITEYGRAALAAAAAAAREPEAILLADANIWPRDDLHRYRVYVVAGDDLRCLAACPSPGGIGQALVQFDSDEREHGGSLSELGVVGVLDAMERRWIVKPFPRKEA